MTKPLLEMNALEFCYPKYTIPVLKIPHLSLQRGEHLFLYGPSGSGKTTLLSLLAGILQPQKGQIKILETEFSQLSGAQRDRFRAEKMGYIFQMFNLVPYLNVIENILLPCGLSKKRSKRARPNPKEEADHLTRKLGLEELLYRPVSALSVGQQQRVAVARAWIGSPDMIIADEPTSALDNDLKQGFLELLFELTEESGATVLFVSHDQSLEPFFKRVEAIQSINEASAA